MLHVLPVFLSRHSGFGTQQGVILSTNYRTRKICESTEMAHLPTPSTSVGSALYISLWPLVRTNSSHSIPGENPDLCVIS